LKRLKQLYFIPILISFLATFLFIWLLISPEYYAKAFLIISVPLVILAIIRKNKFHVIIIIFSPKKM